MRRANGMGSIVFLGKNRRRPWAVRMTDGFDADKQIFRYVGYFETETEAKKALALEYVNPTPKKSNITLKQLFEEWKEPYYRHIGKQTQDCYNAAYYALKPLHKKVFKELRKAHYQNIIDESASSLSSKKKIKTLTVLLYKYAMENDIVNKNYAEFIRLEKEEKAEKEVFTDIEKEAIKKAAKTDLGCRFILMMIRTGFRISEFLQISIFNVDLKNQTMVGGIKTEAGKGRIIPIHPDIINYVAELYDKNARTLIRKENGQAYSAKYFRENVYAAALKTAGVTYRTPHCTRHTFATDLVRAGCSPSEIKYLMGHTNYAFTVDTYVHDNKLEDMRKAINRL